jgi:hypothetical protein
MQLSHPQENPAELLLGQGKFVATIVTTTPTHQVRMPAAISSRNISNAEAISIERRGFAAPNRLRKSLLIGLQT